MTSPNWNDHRDALPGAAMAIHAPGVNQHLRRSTQSSRIFGGSETRDYFLTDDFVRISAGRRRPSRIFVEVQRIFAEVQVVVKKMWIAVAAPSVDGIEIEIAGRFVSLWKATGDKESRNNK